MTVIVFNHIFGRVGALDCFNVLRDEICLLSVIISSFGLKLCKLYNRFYPLSHNSKAQLQVGKM